MSSRVQQIYKRLLAALVIIALILAFPGTIHSFASAADGLPLCGAKILVPDSVFSKASLGFAKKSENHSAGAAADDREDEPGNNSLPSKCCNPSCVPLAAFLFGIRGLNVPPLGQTLDFGQQFLRETDIATLKRPPRSRPSSMTRA